MRIPGLLVVLSTIFSIEAKSQTLWHKLHKEIYVTYGRHLRTNYHTTNGEGSLLTKRNAFAAQAGLNIRKSVTQNLFIQTGLAVHLMFLSEICYGVSGPIPPNGQNFNLHRPCWGIEYIESTTVGIPLKLGYQKRFGGKYIFNFAAGPYIAVYFPASNRMAGSTTSNNGVQTRVYWVTRYFKNHRTNRSLGISYPQIEGEADIEVKRQFRKLGLIGLGLKGHWGTRRLEHSEYVIWPNNPGYTSEGNFKLNRSYVAVFLSYQLGSIQ